MRRFAPCEAGLFHLRRGSRFTGCILPAPKPRLLFWFLFLMCVLSALLPFDLLLRGLLLGVFVLAVGFYHHVYFYTFIYVAHVFCGIFNGCCKEGFNKIKWADICSKQTYLGVTLILDTRLIFAFSHIQISIWLLPFEIEVAEDKTQL